MSSPSIEPTTEQVDESLGASRPAVTRTASADADTDGPVTSDDGLVDWTRTARRVGRSMAVLVALAVTGWLVRATVVGRWTLGDLGNWLGLALAAIFVVELVVVGGSALRGMLRAGERGERLASGDVGILPPVGRRRRRTHDRDDLNGA